MVREMRVRARRTPPNQRRRNLPSARLDILFSSLPLRDGRRWLRRCSQQTPEGVYETSKGGSERGPGRQRAKDRPWERD